jgi:hypothetical protein
VNVIAHTRWRVRPRGKVFDTNSRALILAMFIASASPSPTGQQRIAVEHVNVD